MQYRSLRPCAPASLRPTATPDLRSLAKSSAGVKLGMHLFARACLEAGDKERALEYTGQVKDKHKEAKLDLLLDLQEWDYATDVVCGMGDEECSYVLKRDDIPACAVCGVRCLPPELPATAAGHRAVGAHILPRPLRAHSGVAWANAMRCARMRAGLDADQDRGAHQGGRGRQGARRGAVAAVAVAAQGCTGARGKCYSE